MEIPDKNEQEVCIVDPDDPLLIAQSLTYITDDGSVVLSFTSTPFSFSFKLCFFVFEIIFVVILVLAVPIGAHGTALSVSMVNFTAVAWFWYNSVRSIDITCDGGLRFWIGNVEVEIPYEKIVSMRHINVNFPFSIVSMSLFPHRGFLSNPMDGVAVITSIPSTPFWAWPRSSDKPERKCCFLACPRLVILFSPAGGAYNFIQEVESEMRSFHVDGESARASSKQFQQPPAYPVKTNGYNTSNSSSNGHNIVARPTIGVQGDLFDV